LNVFFLNDWLRNRNFPNVCFQRVFCRMVFCRTELISLLTFAEYKLPIVRFPNKLFPINQFPNIFCRIVLPNGSVSECLFCRMVFCRMSKLRNIVAEWPTLIWTFNHKFWIIFTYIELFQVSIVSKLRFQVNYYSCVIFHFRESRPRPRPRFPYPISSSGSTLIP